MKSTVLVRKKRQVTIPKTITDALNIVQGDVVEIDIRKIFTEKETKQEEPE